MAEAQQNQKTDHGPGGGEIKPEVPSAVIARPASCVKDMTARRASRPKRHIKITDQIRRIFKPN